MGAHDDRDRRRGFLRVLDLVGPNGTFLRRRGIDLRLFGIYLHRIDAPDPGLDLHDHPWPFASLVLSGAYCEEVAPARRASELAAAGRQPFVRSWRRWSVHRIRMTEAHRIIAVEHGTVTLILRGRKTRAWGFFLPAGWVDQTRYDYRARRPLTEVRP